MESLTALNWHLLIYLSVFVFAGLVLASFLMWLADRADKRRGGV